MEYRIKSGADLKCEYTGNAARTLIQIIDIQGSQSNWICREALQDALRLLNALEGVQDLSNPNVAYSPSSPLLGKMEVTCAAATSGAIVTEQLQASQAVTPLSANKRPDPDAVNIEAFQEDCQILHDEPPANHKGEPTLYESHIRELVQRWRKRFKDPKKMYGPLNVVFGVTKERFEVMF